MADKIKVLVVGVGNMGRSHALAYHRMDGFELVGLVSPSIHSRANLPAEIQDYPKFADFDEAMAATKPDAVSINSYTDTHKEYALKAFDANCHVFIEKPLAVTVADAKEIVDAAKAKNELEWRPQIDFAEGMAQTVQWYIDNQPWWQEIKTGHYLKYYEQQYGKTL